MKVLSLVVLTAALAYASLSTEQELRGRHWHKKHMPQEYMEINDNDYEQNKEYLYEYNGQLMTGLPQSSEQHSATRIQALVKIIFKAPTKAVMKIEKVRFGYFNDKVAQPKFVHDFDLFEQVPIEEEKKALLKEPLEFAYEQGLVQDIYFTEQEQPWSANIKRAILNLMQVNVNKQRRTDSQVERLSKIEQRFASSSSESMEELEQPIGQLTDFFTVMENTMEGECETAYTMVKSGEQQVNVTKTINFDKCQRRPEIRYNHRFHKICPTCKTQYEEDKFLQESTVMRQQVKLGQSGSVLIKKAETESLYTIVPITEEGNVIQTYSITQLRLVKKQPVEDVEISRRQFAVKSDSGLIYTPDWDVMKEQYFLNGEEQFQEMTPYSDIKSKVEFVQSIMQKLVHFMRESVEEEAPRQFVRLVKSLRLVTKPELEKIMLEVYEQQQEEFTREEQHKVKSIFVDALAAAGTKTTIEQLVELIKQEKISPLKASIAIRKLQSTRVVSEKIIEQIWQLTSEEYQRQAPVTIYQSAYLTVGSLLNAYCQAELDKLAVAFKPTVAQEQRCTRDTKKEWTNKLIARFEQCSDELCRVTVLKALANAGLDQSANQLEQIIKNKKYNTVVRTEAILATRQLLEIMPRKVEKMLMPVFMSKREQPVVRMTAFFKLIQTQPEKFILDQLTHSLHKEQNKQVAAFVYTTLQEFANSTNPCLERMSEDIKLSLAHARGLPVEQWMQRSKFLRAEIFPQQTSNGAMFDIQSLFGNNSMLPTDISTTLRLNVNKQWYRNAFQVGIMQQNVEQYLRQLTRRFSHNLQQNLDTAFENIVDGRWSEEQTSPKFRKELDNIFDDLSIEEREEQWVRQEQKQSIAYLYFRIMNQDYGFLPLSKEILPEQILDILTSEQMSLRKLLKAGERLLKAQEIKMPFDVSTAAQIHEMSKKIPTTIGLPLIFSSKLPMVAQARGHLVIKIDKEAKKVELELIETKPSIVVSQVTKVETWSPIVNTGLKVVAQAKIYAPLSVKIEAKLENMRPIVKIAMKPVDKKYELVRIQTRPSTLVRVWPKQISQYQEPEERTIQGEQWTRINKAQKTFGEQALGIKIQTYYQWHSQPLKHVQGTPIPLFAGPNQMVVRIEPGMDMPREIELTVEGNLFEKLGKSAGLKPEFDNFYTSESDEYLNERSESSSQESREYQRERRQSHEQYYKQYESEQSTAHQIKLTLQGKGSSIERRAQLTVDCRLESSQQKAGKCEVEIKRTPIPELESSEWKLQSKIEFLYPKSVRSVQDIDAARKLMIRVKSQWGEQSQEQKNVDIKIVGEQSRKMEQLVKESLYQQHSRMENQERRSLFSPVAQYEHVQKLGLLDQYKVDVDYKNVPKQLKNITEQVLDALKAYYYMQTEIDHVPREQHNSFQQDGKKGQIRVLVNVDPISRQAVNVTIEKLNEKVAIMDIPLKYALPVASMQRQGKPAQSLYELVSEQASSYEQNLCKVRSERVTSFNDVEYMAPISTCYSLVAKDCTRRSQFAVLLKRLSESSERKQLKIVARNVELIVKPKKTQSQEQNEIVELEYILNGEKKHISEIERVLEHGEHVVLRVTEEETGYARIQLPEAGIKVYFDGYAANVKASSMHGQRLCGLCGQLEPEYYEEECELRDAENECVSAQSTQELKRLFKSYVQDKEECSGEQQRFYSAEEKYEYEPLQWTEQHYQHIDEQYNDEEYQREVQPVRRTRVIEQLHELCFSKQPVPKCPKGTQPTDFKQGHVKVAYTCMPRNDVQAEEYLRQAQQERVVVDVEELPASFTQTEKVPQQCEKIQY